MPKVNIDHQKTVIYKIESNDSNITDLYVGSTTNFVKRKYEHKTNCNNVNRKGYNSNVYKFIRANGGWDNFTMVWIEDYPCNSKVEALAQEQYHYKLLKAKLNSNVPGRNKKDYLIDNKNKIQEQKKRYNKDNQDKIQEYQHQYRQDNKLKIQERQKTKFDCPCGGKYTNTGKARHIKSKKHQQYLN